MLLGETQSSSITIRELSLWIDLELAYSEDNWGAYAGVYIQPVSDYNVSGSVHYGEGSLPLDAERALPIDVTAGGWYSAVPEPTSGLLLLLGMAGLALKRKRA